MQEAKFKFIAEINDILETVLGDDSQDYWKTSIRDAAHYSELSDEELLKKVGDAVLVLKNFGPLVFQLRQRFGAPENFGFMMKTRRRRSDVGITVRAIFDHLEQHPEGLEFKKVIEFAQKINAVVTPVQIRYELESTHRFVEMNGLWYTLLQFQRRCMSLEDLALKQYAIYQVVKVLNSDLGVVTITNLKREIFGKFGEVEPERAHMATLDALSALKIKYDTTTGLLMSQDGSPYYIEQLRDDFAYWLRRFLLDIRSTQEVAEKSD